MACYERRAKLLRPRLAKLTDSMNLTLLDWRSSVASVAMAIFILLLPLTISSAYADPPKNAQRIRVSFPATCTPTLTEMMSALIEDHAVHVSTTFESSAGYFVMIVENPNTKKAAVLHIRGGRTCLVFSGLNLKNYERNSQPG